MLTYFIRKNIPLLSIKVIKKISDCTTSIAMTTSLKQDILFCEGRFIESLASDVFNRSNTNTKYLTTERI